MKTIEMTVYGQKRQVFPTTGAVVNGKQIVGIFLHEDDARSPLADDQAFAIVRYDELTSDQQAIADMNSDELE